MKYTDIVGKTFGKLTAIKPVIKDMGNGRSRTLWVFKCSCGELTERAAHRVVTGWITSCGCAAVKKKYAGERSVAYGIYLRTYSDGDLTFEKFESLITEKCHYCGVAPSNSYNLKSYISKKISATLVYNGLDRLNSDLPHNMDNVVPCCWKCNKFKSNMHVDEFLNHIKAIYKHRIAD